jgi:hypothetical protein
VRRSWATAPNHHPSFVRINHNKYCRARGGPRPLVLAQPTPSACRDGGRNYSSKSGTKCHMSHNLSLHYPGPPAPTEYYTGEKIALLLKSASALIMHIPSETKIVELIHVAASQNYTCYY